MVRWFGKILATCALIAAGSVGIWYWQGQREIDQLREQKHVLEQVVQRLTDEKRIAEVVVESQKTVNGVPQSTLLFVETDKSGKDLPPKRFNVIGSMAHIDAMVIKFDRHFVSEGDPLRGHSIALFTRIYGDQQSPAEAAVIDAPGQAPDVYRSVEPGANEFEQSLWRDFWRLADDADFRNKHGVRVANGQGVWGPFEPEKLYTITLESDGGLNITSEPLKGIYRELLHDRASQTAPAAH